MTEDLHGLNLVELIDRLEDAPVPPPISMMPQTAGWLVLAGLLVCAIAFAIHKWVGYRRATAYRRAALDAIHQSDDDPAQISAILRRAALVAYPRADVAALSGQAWLTFLDDTFPGDGFADGVGRVLATAPFRPEQSDPAVGELAKAWVTHHRQSKEAR